ncbi:glycerophosphodiester phosphodiesterase family protein [Fodinibius sp. SL11]|uniref:glycerophosphodiester phosphodiesterase family protein n=1 Tax=Fodinibius sp. SL11 TaxID=3425690 RepID=UPI003F885B07
MFIINLMNEFIQRVWQSTLVRSTWRRVIHLWKPMLAWTILVWGIIAIILAPASSAVLGLDFFRSGQLVVGNEQLLSWMLSPVGASYILLGAALTLTGWILWFVGLFQIVADDINKQTVDFRNIIYRILSKTYQLFRLCLFIVAIGLLLLLPLAGGLALVYELLLDNYDINYYLSATPVEWHITIITSVVWFLIWLSGIIYLAGRFLFALPMYLHSQKSIRESLRYVWETGAQKANKRLKSILATISFWVLIRFIADAVLLAASFWIISWISDFANEVRIIALATGIYLMASLLLDTLLSFLGFSYVSTLITKLYFQDFQQLNGPSAPRSRYKFRRLGSKIKKVFRPQFLLPLVGGIAFISFFFSGYLIEQIPKTNSSQVNIAAHRAGPSPAPENTLQALELTMQTKAEWAEIDVQLSRDSVVVVAHDVDLMRIAGNPVTISETDYKHLQKILGKAYAHDRSIQQRIHTLDDFLAASHGNIGLMIELKQTTEVLAHKVIEAINDHGMESKVMIMSLDLDTIRLIQKIAPDITIGYVSAISIGDKSQLPVDLLAINHRAITTSLINKTKQQGIKVYAWTVNRANIMAKMIEYNVDGIITDKPKLAVQIREELQNLSATERLLLQFNQLIDVKID